MNPPRVGVAALITCEGRILLLRRTGAHGAGTWSTPGGHLDPGEAPDEAAIRETFEETGLRIRDPRFRAVTNDIFDPTRHYITLWFEAEADSGAAAVNAPDELTAVGWFAWDALPEPLFLSLENLLAGRCWPPPDSTRTG